MTQPRLAGWQPDPYRRFEQRYWDGERWTEHVSSAGLQGTDPIEEQLQKPEAALTPEERHERRQVDAEFARRSSRRALIIAGGVVAVIALFLVGSLLLGDDSESGTFDGEGGATAARACVSAQEALRDFARGTRSAGTTFRELEDASEDARRATRLNSKWLPVAQAIEGARRELEAGTPGTAARSLVRSCGLG